MSRYIDEGYVKAVMINDRLRQGNAELTLYMQQVERQVSAMPSIDIVRCQDCRHRYMDADLQVWTCTYGLMIKPDGFCNYGEREGE